MQLDRLLMLTTWHTSLRQHLSPDKYCDRPAPARFMDIVWLRMGDYGPCCLSKWIIYIPFVSASAAVYLGVLKENDRQKGGEDFIPRSLSRHQWGAGLT